MLCHGHSILAIPDIESIQCSGLCIIVRETAPAHLNKINVEIGTQVKPESLPKLKVSLLAYFITPVHVGPYRTTQVIT